MDHYVVVRVVPRPLPKLPRDERVAFAISHWARVAQWPPWFAKNVVLWRKHHGLHWESCR